LPWQAWSQSALAGCGSGGKTTSVPWSAITGVSPAPSAAIPPNDGPGLQAVDGRVLRSSDLPDFSPETTRTLGINARAWVAKQGLPPGEQAKEAARLERLGFARGFGGSTGAITGYNVAFAAGPFYYLVGVGSQTDAPLAPTRAQLIAAARRLYGRVAH
jgi:hypothetical protein